MLGRVTRKQEQCSVRESGAISIDERITVDWNERMGVEVDEAWSKV